MAAKKKSGPSWTTLSTAAGKATKVPALLKAMQAAGPDAEVAMRKLASLLVAGGRAFDAAPVVVQTLAEQLESGAGERLHILSLIRYLVSLGEPGMRDHTGLALSRPEVREKYDEPTAKALLETITELSPRWRGMLADADPFVRAAAAHLLGLLPGAAAENVTALATQLSKEKDRGVRVSSVFALGQLARAESAVTSVVRKQLSTLGDDPSDPLVRGVAVVMQAAVDGAFAKNTDAALGDMFAALALYLDVPYMQQRANETERPDWAFRFFSWNGGALDVLSFGLITEVGGDEARRLLARAIGDALARELPIGRISPARKEWPERVLRWFFAERKEPITSADELTDLQKEVLRALSLRENNGSYEAYGLPSDARSRQRLLGMRPPSILERREGTQPLWIALQKVRQEFTFAKTTDDFETFVRARLPLDLTAREWLDLWAECETNAYLLRNWLEFPPLKGVARYGDTVIAEWADAWAKAIALDPSLRPISTYVLLTYLRTRPADYELPARYDDAFSFGSGSDAMAREVFGRFPTADREAIARRSLSDPGDESATRLLAYPELAPAAAEILRRLKPANANFFAPRPVSGDLRFCEHIEPHEQLRRLYQTRPLS